MEHQKHLFQLPPDIHYLNCAYKAPQLSSAEEAAIRALARQRNPAALAPVDFFDEVNTAKALFGTIVNCRPSDVAVIPSASYGFASVLKNTPGSKGQQAITIENEFPSAYFSLRRWCDTNGCDMVVVGPGRETGATGEEWNERILGSINEKTAVVLMSSVHWISGLKFDLERIGRKCRSVGARFIVDGTQSVGALPMDTGKYHIDALVCAGYKWLFGPYSLGLAHIGEAFRDGVPLEETWMNRTNAADFGNLCDYDPNYTEGAGRYGMGEASNLILMPMLIEGLKQVATWSVPGIQNYCKELTQPLLHYLYDLGAHLESEEYFSNHLFGLKLPPGIDPALLRENLMAGKIILSVRNGALRVAVNVFNTRDDIRALIGAIDHTLNGRVLTQAGNTARATTG